MIIQFTYCNFVEHDIALNAVLFLFKSRGQIDEPSKRDKIANKTYQGYM